VIKVKQLSPHLFAVDLSGDHLSIVQEVSEMSPYNEAEVLYAVLKSLLRLDTNNILFKE